MQYIISAFPLGKTEIRDVTELNIILIAVAGQFHLCSKVFV